MEISTGYWILENGKRACVAFQFPATGIWYGVVEGESQTMPRGWDRQGRDGRNLGYSLKVKD